MFMLLVCLEIAAILLCMICFILLYQQRETKLVKHMMMIAALAIIQNVGFLLELFATDSASVMNAIRIEYLGGAFVAHFNLLFALEYNKIRIRKQILAIPFLLGFLTLFCVFTYPWNTFFYTSADFVYSGLYPHVVLGKGPYYLLYFVLVYSETIGCLVLMLRKLTMSRQRVLRRNVKYLFIASLLPIFGHLLDICDVFSGYDPTPLSVAISAGFFGIVILKNHFFDIVETAKDSLLESLDDAVVIVDADLRLEDANPSAYKHLPFMKRIVNGMQISDPDFVRIIRNGGYVETSIGDRYYDVHVNPVDRGNVHTGYAVVYFDVTERKYRMDRMAALSRQAESAIETKSALLSNVSYDIRTPIQAILGLNEVILRDYRDPQLTEYARSIQSSAYSLLELINQLLDFSKIESGEMNLTNSVYDVQKLLKKLISVNRYRAEHKGLVFLDTVEEQVPKYLFGDEARVHQIIANLLSNAIKFTDKGGVDFSVRFEKINSTEGNLRIYVSDTGVGIRKADIPKLFEGFVKLDEQKQRVTAGTGLGLTIVKNLLDMMEGEIHVESTFQKGSAFEVVIPQKLVDDKIIADHEDPEWERDFTAPRACVLVVDDSRINLKVIEALLKPTLVQIDTATGGSECLDKICKKRYDMIFLDQRMPYMDGVETLERMRHMSHLSNGAPVIALTANVVGESARDYLDIGFDDFLAKPITEKQIDEMLKKHLSAGLIEGV